MSNITVIGTQWGDEGKGKIVDWLSKEADIVVRFQGGHNAGHTLVIDGTTYKLHMLPSGVVRPGKLSIIGNGVVIDPWALLREIAELSGQGIAITPDTLKISESAPVILPIHSARDKSSEASLGKDKIGTTGRGIGPAYEDKIGRRSLRMCDLAHPEHLRTKVEKIFAYHNTLRAGLDLPPIDIEEEIKKIEEISGQLAPYISPVWRTLNKAQESKKKILFEGAQGVMLDVDHGTYPFVTSSNTVAPNAATGSGVGAHVIGYVLGITKAYTTRVGTGPLPTAIEGEIENTLVERGHEFGTTTGRRRRCGWFDAVQVRQAVTLSGVRGIALMKMDVMDTLPEIKICVGYTYKGKKYDYIPASPDVQNELEPVYETMPGWQTSLRGARKLSQLPEKALQYIHRIEELIGIPAVIVSTSPEREDTIMIKNILA